MNWSAALLGLAQGAEIFAYSYFSYVVGYTFLFSAAGRLRKPLRFARARKKARIAVLIPAYKEDAVILDTARRALEQDYPAEAYQVVVIADSLQPKTLTELSELPIRLLPVNFEKSTKVKALNAALATLAKDKFDLALILDADNVMAPDFLEHMNAAYQQGHQAIQGRRVAKNDNTQLAVLDGLSEAINNHIYRQGSTALGMASSLIGSGMAFSFPLLRDTLASMESIGGFDRELEVRLLARGICSVYVPDARVQDEKVSQQEVFVKQRRRWISSQYIYLRRFLKPGTLALFKGQLAYFNSAVLRNIQLPRLLNIGLLGVFTLLFSLMHSYSVMGAGWWWTLSGGLAMAIAMAIPKSYFSKKTLRALAQIPKTFFSMFGLLFRLRGANSQFIHTQKGMLKTESK